jgi:hypothetical protein
MKLRSGRGFTLEELKVKIKSEKRERDADDHDRKLAFVARKPVLLASLLTTVAATDPTSLSN